MTKGLQKFPLTEKFASSHGMLLENDENAITLNAGRTYPENPLEGMLCFRTDLDQIHIYKSSNWILLVDLKDIPLSKKSLLAVINGNEKLGEDEQRIADALKKSILEQIKSNVPELKWSEVQNKPEHFPSKWEDIQGKPEHFPAKWEEIENRPIIKKTISWSDVIEKPNFFDGNWSHLNGKPEHFPSKWEDIQGKPEHFPAKWEDIQGKPEQKPVKWEDIQDKPEKTKVKWGDIDDKPSKFTPQGHSHETSDILGFEKIRGIARTGNRGRIAGYEEVEEFKKSSRIIISKTSSDFISINASGTTTLVFEPAEANECCVKSICVKAGEYRTVLKTEGAKWVGEVPSWGSYYQKLVIIAYFAFNTVFLSAFYSDFSRQ